VNGSLEWNHLCTGTLQQSALLPELLGGGVKPDKAVPL
jgi:hypothetical protein